MSIVSLRIVDPMFETASDWTDPAPYAAIARRGRAALAWEVLRRMPGYPTEHTITDWGLHFR